jgi:type II secretory pathway component PulC
MASWARVLPGPRGGLVLQMVRRGTPLEALGFQSGDRLHALNGVTLGGIEQMLQMYVQLKNASRVAVTVERNGALRIVDYLVR